MYHNLIILIVACLMVSGLYPEKQATLFAQVNSDDPFTGNYRMADNSEIFILYTDNMGNGDIDTSGVYSRIIDVNGPVTGNNLLTTEQIKEPASTPFINYDSQMDILTADIDGDGLDDVVTAWESTDSSIVLMIPHIDPVSLIRTGATRVVVQDLGFPKLYGNATAERRRFIRLIPGQFDDDIEQEFVLAYFADDPDPTGGPIQLILFDTDGTKSPHVIDSYAGLRLSPLAGNDNSSILGRSCRFDITSGDYDGDYRDELVVFFVEPFQGGTDGWQLRAQVFDVGDSEELLPGTTSEVLLDEAANSRYYLFRLAVTSGDFNGDLTDEVVFGWEVSPNNATEYDIRLQCLRITAQLDSLIAVGTPRFYRSGSGSKGWPMSMTAGDADLDGRDEILHMSQYGLEVYKTDHDLNIGSSIGTISNSVDPAELFHRTVAVTDVDITASDSMRTEVIIADVVYSGDYGRLLRIRIFQSMPAADGLDFASNPTAEYLDTLANDPENMVMAVGDFDGDAVQLGPPSKQTRTGIVQPLVILNAPPIHFDVFDGQNYDIGKCYSDNPDINCEHRASYINASDITKEVTTQVSGDWSVSKSLTAEVGVEYGPVEASVSATLSRKYGKGFSNVNGSTDNFYVKLTSDAVEDDRIYATIADYDILEYPVYSSGDLLGYVVTVVPKLIGLTKLQNTWFGSKGGNAQTYIPNHEVGNILSYPTTVELPPGASLFGFGDFSGGGADTWEMSANSTQTWELSFSSTEISERERSAFQEVSRSVSGEVSGSWGPVRASLSASISGTYSNSSISTHRTTVQNESALSVEFGTVDGGILGSKTYKVSPFVYWASNGALVLDYAVNPDISPGVASWWEEKYGSKPDLTFILPWKYDFEKGLGSTDPEVQAEETRDIVFNPLNPHPGESISIGVRVYNYSLLDNFDTTSVRFYVGDPDNGGLLIVNQSGQSEVPVPPVNAQEYAIARLDNWLVPANVGGDTKIYAVVDPGNHIDEVHEDNNTCWKLLNYELKNPTAVITQTEAIPGNYRLGKNYPNPFNPLTTINFDLPDRQPVKVTVYNVLGEAVGVLLERTLPAGRHHVVWDASGMASGVYFYRLQAGKKFISTEKLILLR